MPRDGTTVLGRLLSDRALRQDFGRNRTAVLDVLGVRTIDRAALLRLDVQDLAVQADGLIDKRLHAVMSLLPRLKASLGAQVRAMFEEYADSSEWPTGLRPHERDSAAFAAYVAGREPGMVNQAELNRVRFLADGHRWRLHFTMDALAGRWPALQWLFRRRGEPRQCLVYLGL